MTDTLPAVGDDASVGFYLSTGDEAVDTLSATNDQGGGFGMRQHAQPSMGTVRAVSAISTLVEGFIVTHRNTPASQAIGRKILGRFVDVVGDRRPDELSEEDITAWWTAISPDSAASSRRAYYSTVKCFLRWLGYDHLMGVIAPPREPRRAPQTLSAAEVDAMRMSCTTTRDRAIIELAWGIGLRCIEIAALEVPDLDWNARIVTVHGKGGHVDELPLPQRVAWAIERYYQDAPPAATGPVIRNLNNPRHGITAHSVSVVVTTVAWRSGVKRAAFDGRGAHGLRRTCATELLDSGATITEVQAVLRHESLASTQRYLRRASTEDMRRVLDRRIDAAG